MAITLATEHYRHIREQRLHVLRMLINTRMMPADPAYTIAINLVPVEFNKHQKVMTAWREYNSAVRFQPSPANASVHDGQVRAKQTTLIFEIMKSLGFALSESEIQTEACIASGFVDRDNLYLDSLRAMRDIASATQRSAQITERLIQQGNQSGQS